MKTVIGLFRDREEAIRTINDLERVGAHHDDISVISRESIDDLGGIHLDSVMVPGMGQLVAGGPLTTFLHTGAAESSPDLLVGALTRMGIPRDEAFRYVDGVRQGCTLETVSIDDDHASEALEVMQAHAIPADFDEGTSRVRQQQLSSNLGSTSGIRSNLGGQNLDRDYDTDIETGRGIGANLRGRDVNLGRGEQAVPIAEEQLEVGKREVSAGGVRVQTHVEERPVEENVELRNERVHVERRKVDREASAGDQLFQERTIELTATAEKPVVTKRARVIEEIVLKKDVDTRTETIRDTVRRTEADVQNLGDRDLGYREHYDRNLSGTMGEDDYDYDSYKPAYSFGSGMRSDRRFQGDTWDDVEPNARSAWEERNPGTWEKMKMAVRHAWERTKS